MTPLTVSEGAKDIVESIVAVKGPIYMSIITHAINLGNIQGVLKDTPLAEGVVMVHAGVMSALCVLAEIDLDDAATKKEFFNNIEIVRASIEVNSPLH